MKRFLKRLRPQGDLDSQGFEYTIRESLGMYQANQKLAQSFGRILSADILKFKKSDTLFLLGSGPSINRLSEGNFREIGEHDSIGFNFWLAHDFIPTYYLFQLPSHSRTPFLELFDQFHHKYADLPFILRGSALARNRIDFDDPKIAHIKTKDVYLLNEYAISSRCSIDIIMLIDYAAMLGFMEFGRIAGMVPKWRGTLGLLISLAYQMGYKKIVLCGMDMQDNLHFWDDSRYSELKKRFSLPDGTNITEMTNPDRSTNTVPNYVYALSDWMREKNNVEVYVANPQTVLYPRVPLYGWKY